MTITAIKAVNALKRPAVAWEAWADKMKPEQREGYIKALEEMAIRAAWMAGYLESRHGSGCGDQGHADAVKNSDKVRTRIRRALGYNVTHSVSF